MSRRSRPPVHEDVLAGVLQSDRESAGQQASATTCRASASPTGVPAGEIIVGLRPESLELSAEGISCEVEVVEEIGADAYVFAAAEVGKLVARVDAKRAPERGARIALRPNGDEAHLFDPATGSRISNC
jgi:ABC-type sugar transport system ATPase subunit